MTIGEYPPNFHKPWLINPGLTLFHSCIYYQSTLKICTSSSSLKSLSSSERAKSCVCIASWNNVGICPLRTFAWHGEVPAYLSFLRPKKWNWHVDPSWGFHLEPSTLRHPTTWDMQPNLDTRSRMKPEEASSCFRCGGVNIYLQISKKNPDNIRQHQTTQKAPKKPLIFIQSTFLGWTVWVPNFDTTHPLAPPCAPVWLGGSGAPSPKMPGFSHHFSIQMAIFFEVQSFMFGHKKQKNSSKMLVFSQIQHFDSPPFNKSLISPASFFGVSPLVGRISPVQTPSEVILPIRLVAGRRLGSVGLGLSFVTSEERASGSWPKSRGALHIVVKIVENRF